MQGSRTSRSLTAIVRDRRRCGSGLRGSFVQPLEGPGEEVDEPERCAAQWAQLDPTKYPFVRQVAAQLPGHDDREQFLAGIDLILNGITTAR